MSTARRDTWIAAGLALVLAIAWIPFLPRTPTWGWDESMHAELPALRMLLSLKLDALLDCAQYPFGYPLVLAFAQGIFGVGEAVARATTTAIWCVALFGLYLLAREASVSRRAPWIAMGLGALSPMALAYAGTLFLEIPFVCASIWTLRAWMRRGIAPFRAGAWIAACLFTKWNYGLLLAFGLFVDWGIDLVRAEDKAGFLRGSVRLAIVPALAIAWWFVLPLPGGFGLGASHRAVFLDFLGGNRDLARVPFGRRALDAACWLEPTPRMLLLVVVAAFVTLRRLREPAVRTLWIVLLAMTVPVLAHPFHLDRFLLPVAVAWWSLAAVGLASLRLVVLGALAVLALAFPMTDTRAVARALGFRSEDPAIRAYQESILRGWKDLSGSRPLPTAGLAREEADALLDLAAHACGPDERVGWIGISNELSPALVQIGLLERGGSRARFLRDATKPMDVTYFGVDPGLDDAALARFAEGFDVIFSTEPADLRGRPGRAFESGYRQRLGWTTSELGQVAISRPLREPLSVTLIACRPKR